MTLDRFATCLAIVLHEEGGYVDNPRDPGGMTNCGVTVRTWREWTGKGVTEADMRALTPQAVAPLYRARYWQAAACDRLGLSIALCVFDMAVNGGVAQAGRLLQGVVGAVQDGNIGPATIAAAQQFATAHGMPEIVRQYQQARRNFYRSLSTFATFGRGWLARVDRVETAALKLIERN